MEEEKEEEKPRGNRNRNRGSKNDESVTKPAVTEETEPEDDRKSISERMREAEQNSAGSAGDEGDPDVPKVYLPTV